MHDDDADCNEDNGDSDDGSQIEMLSEEEDSQNDCSYRLKGSEH